MTEAEKERAAVVAWIRANGSALIRSCAKSIKLHDYENAANSNKLARRDFKTANAIERGEHLK